MFNEKREGFLFHAVYGVMKGRLLNAKIRFFLDTTKKREKAFVLTLLKMYL